MSSSLDWYKAVASNKQPAKYLIAKKVSIEISLTELEELLWQELDRVTSQFLTLWKAIRQGEISLNVLPGAEPNLMDLCVELTKRMLTHCNFCRWNCLVDRSKGTKHGTCQLESASRVSSFFHHRGEELIYRGNLGSGTIFFTSCNMRCAFCQNGDISTDKENGIEITPRQLATMAYQLRLEGCHNINWVGGDPTIHLHNIIEAISLLSNLRPKNSDLMSTSQAKADGFFLFSSHPEIAFFGEEFNAPMLWNSNFFMSEPTMKILRILMDVWLPDFKFGPKCSIPLSRTPWYWETVTENLTKIYQWGENFTIRHLVMPNHVECCTKPCLDWVKENMPEAPLNIMDQYHPDNYCNPKSSQFNSKYQELARKPTLDELEESFAYAKELKLNFETLSFEKNLIFV